MNLLGVFVAVLLPFATPTAHYQRVVVHLIGCRDCAPNAVGVSMWDESSDRPIIPTVIARAANQVVLGLNQGYYRVWMRTKACTGDRFVGVLDDHNRPLALRMRCDGRVIVRLVDGAHGLAGTIPKSAVEISMQPADGESQPRYGTIAGDAYYFDETNCQYCVLSVKLIGGPTATIGLDLKSRDAFSLIRRDLWGSALKAATSVRGSPFNAPETLVQGPQSSVWALDRLGNRVAVIESGSHGREYDLPTPFADAGNIIATSRYVWVTERRVGKIVRFGIDGSHKEFAILRETFLPEEVLAMRGPDGRVWFTDGLDVGAINEDGAVAYYRPPGRGWIDVLTAGADGRVWIAGSDWVSGTSSAFIDALSTRGVMRPVFGTTS
jgi:hypothetical protein